MLLRSVPHSRIAILTSKSRCRSSRVRARDDDEEGLLDSFRPFPFPNRKAPEVVPPVSSERSERVSLDYERVTERKPFNVRLSQNHWGLVSRLRGHYQLNQTELLEYLLWKEAESLRNPRKRKSRAKASKEEIVSVSRREADSI